jgi:signal recognition particle GTPase
MMADFDKFGLAEYQELMKTHATHMGLFGMKRHLPWVKNDPEFIKMQKTLRFFELLNGQELRDHKLIRSEAKARLASAAGMSAQEVNSILQQFKTQSVLFEVIKRERVADRPLPTTQAESSRLIAMYSVRDPSMIKRLTSYKPKNINTKQSAGGRGKF